MSFTSAASLSVFTSTAALCTPELCASDVDPDDLSEADLFTHVREVEQIAAMARTRAFLLAAAWADRFPDPVATARATDTETGCTACPVCAERLRESWFDLREWGHPHSTLAEADQRCSCGAWCRFAETHPEGTGVEGTGVEGTGFGRGPQFRGDPWIPAVDPHAVSTFAAAVGRTPLSASLLIRDALITRHRLPRLWARVVTGTLDPPKARLIANAVAGHPADVATAIDTELAPIAHRIGKQGVDNKLHEVMMRLHAEIMEIRRIEELDARHVTLHEESINHLGIAEMSIRADWKDLADFDDTINRIAHALKNPTGPAPTCPDSLPVRRARALGIIADPATALALLTPDPHQPSQSKPDQHGPDQHGSDQHGPDQHGSDQHGPDQHRPDHNKPGQLRRTSLIVHLNEANLSGIDPIAFLDASGPTGRGRPVLAEIIREWCSGRRDQIVVLPVLDLGGHDHTDAYRPRTSTIRRADLNAETCVFPYCTRPATACDHDHQQPHPSSNTGGTGPSCDCNISPLCRRHHRLKTHTAWHYRRLDHDRWLWTDPYHNHYLRDRYGTILNTSPDGTRSDSARPDSTGPDSARPDSTGPDSARPDSTGPDSARPDRVCAPEPRGSDPRPSRATLACAIS